VRRLDLHHRSAAKDIARQQQRKRHDHPTLRIPPAQRRKSPHRRRQSFRSTAPIRPIHIGDSYVDLGATITASDADKNPGIRTFVNGRLVSSIVIDTSQVATDTVHYVATSLIPRYNGHSHRSDTYSMRSMPFERHCPAKRYIIGDDR
jgi:hypothetical protein